MASVPDIATFMRKPRLGSTPKIRPLMKLEWNKLLAEATEKDVEFKNDIGDEEEYYDDETQLEKENGVEDKENCEKCEEELPLNLCNKSHTIPMPGNKFPNSLDVLDLSAKKKKGEVKTSRKSNEHKKQNFSEVSNLQFNQDSPKKCINESTSKESIELSVENKENLIDYKRNICTTPCNNNKPSIQDKNGRQLENSDKIKSCSKNENLVKQNLIFFSEKKMQTNKNLVEKVRSSKEDVQKKLDFIAKRERMEHNEKPNADTPAQIKPSQPGMLMPQKFAIPAAPKHKESSKILIINKKSYQILAPLGKGGSSKVYLVLNSEYELLAVKCVRLSDVSESTKNDYLNEIQHLMKMQHCQQVIKLYDHQYLSSQKLLLVVMERGETDLSRFLKDKASSDEGISPELIMYYWTEMLMAVKSIHDNNIIHRDLKPANFLLVSGRLKLIDFGIASSIQTEQTSIFMESQSGTFNYMSPEALQDLGFDNKIVHKIGRKTDVWSLGCILYYFLYKKTPYQDLVKPLHKLKAITDPNFVVPFPKISGVPGILIESCKRCLIHDTKKRASIEELLAFRNRPLYSLSQVLSKLEGILSTEDYKKAAKVFEDEYRNDDE